MNFYILAERLPSATFCSPFGGGRYKSCRITKNAWDRHTYGTDTHLGQTDTHMGQTDTHMGQTHIWDRHTYEEKVEMLKTFLFLVRFAHS